MRNSPGSWITESQLKKPMHNFSLSDNHQQHGTWRRFQNSRNFLFACSWRIRLHFFDRKTYNYWYKTFFLIIQQRWFFSQCYLTKCWALLFISRWILVQSWFTRIVIKGNLHVLIDTISPWMLFELFSLCLELPFEAANLLHYSAENYTHKTLTSTFSPRDHDDRQLIEFSEKWELQWWALLFWVSKWKCCMRIRVREWVSTLCAWWCVQAQGRNKK